VERGLQERKQAMPDTQWQFTDARGCSPHELAFSGPAAKPFVAR